MKWGDLTFEEQAAAARFGGPAEWSKFMHPDWSVPRFARGLSTLLHEEIDLAMRSGSGGIVLVSLPPGHNKSYIASINLPEWFLEKWPHKNVALAAYGHLKAAEWGEQIRNDIRDNPDKFLVRLRPDTTAKNRFHTTQGGGLLCTGVGGPLTGFRSHLMIVDDPVKDDEEAQSELMRDKHWNWFRKVALTRRWPDAVTVVVMTRWHEDDLVGRIEQLYREHEGDELPRLRVVRIPCIAEDNDPLGREPGDPLWPEVGYGLDWARKTRALVGSHVWSAMYQQRPSPMGGGMFQRRHFRYWSMGADGSYVLHGDPETKVQPPICWRGQTCDTAMKVKTVNDWTVCFTYAVTHDRKLIALDVARERLEVPEQLPFIRMQRSRWRPRFTAVEEKGSGVGLIQEARRQGLILKPLKADTDKVTRAAAAAVLYEQGAVFHKRDAPWLDEFERELLGFPNGAHDDQVDALSHAVNELGSGVSLLSGDGKKRDREGTDMARGRALTGMV